MESRSDINSKTALLILGFILFVFVIFAWPALLNNWDTSKTDQRYFLGLALDIKEGIRLTDGNRNPLLPMILSTFARQDWSFFTNAKILNLSMSIGLLFLLFFINSHLFDKRIALLSVALTAYNVDFVNKVATFAIAEAILTIWFTLAIYFWFKGAQTESRRYFFLAGIFTGIGYLTKGTGQILFGSFLIWFFINGYFKKPMLLSLAGFVLGYIIVASPLFVYNEYTWGNPFYNYNSSTAMWLDGWEDVYRDTSEAAGFINYFTTHSTKDIWARVSKGAVVIIRDRADILFPIYSVVMLLFSFFVFFRDALLKKRVHRIKQIATKNNRLFVKLASFPLIVLMVWFLFFTWYWPISYSHRHFIPLLPAVNTMISVLFIKSLSLIQVTQNRKNVLNVILVTIILVFGIYNTVKARQILAQINGSLNIYLSDREHNSDLDQLIAGLKAMKNSGVIIVSGPNQLLPEWHIKGPDVKLYDIPPEIKSADQLVPFFDKVKADFLIVDIQTLKHRPFLQEFLRVKNRNDLIVIKDIPDMNLMANYKMDGKHIMIYQRNDR